MNLLNLRQNHFLLLTHMKEAGYSESYIHSVQIEINQILLREKHNSWNSYQDIYQNYASNPHSERSLLRKATVIGIIARFDLEGLYPGKHQWPTLWERGVYTQLIPEFRALVDHYRDLADTLQICGNTVKTNLSAISNFLCFLQKAGCRACDIAGMTFGSVDWERERLHIFQRKTSVPVELPLSPLVGNAIFDYLMKERPQSTDEHIFLSKSRPHPPLTSRGLGSAVVSIMKKSGIRQEPGDRRGSHIFRHHAATSMLEKGIQIPVISKILGHTAPDSINPYLHADFVHLKECSISIEKYPVSEEVFVL